MKAYVGTSGWMYKHWNKRFFPPDLPKQDWLKFYGSRFNTVEVNTTFYHMARQSTFFKWTKESPRGFLFTLKMYRLFTHYRRLNLSKEDTKTLEAFFRNAALLKSKLGAILIQLPPSFKADAKRLKQFINTTKLIEKKLKQKFKLAIEFRHATWFTDETYQILKQAKIAFVVTNSPAWPSKTIRTADFIYMRFHGRTKLFASNYTKKELEEWARTLNSLKSGTIFAYFNNDANAFAADNAAYLAKLLA
jgi:uncharacterized protein YecE (DUF72 family)